MLKRLQQHWQPAVAILRLQGKIQAGNNKSGQPISYDSALPLIRRAFKQRRLAAVALRVNSPGGSAVQSDLIRNCIRQHAIDHNVPVYAFIEDVAASGGYYLACSGEKIFANRHSIIGSIGAVSVHFALYSGLQQLHVPAKMYRAGKRKAIGTGLEPDTEEAVQMKKYILDGVHREFIAMVRESRGDRLAVGRDEELFEGDVWMPVEAEGLGLIDGIGDLASIMRRELGSSDVRFVEIKPKFGDTFAAFSANLPHAAAAAAAATSGQTLPLAAAAAAAAAGGAGSEELLLWRPNAVL